MLYELCSIIQRVTRLKLADKSFKQENISGLTEKRNIFLKVLINDVGSIVIMV